MTGETVQGYWFDGTQEYAARRRGEDFDRMRFATLETLTLSPLPCWKHLPEEKQRQLAAALVAEIESEAAIRRQRTGSPVLGASAVRGQHPFDRPTKSKKSPAPLFHAASKVIRRELYGMYRWFATVPAETVPAETVPSQTPDGGTARAYLWGDVLSDVKAALPDLPEVFDKRDLCQAIGYKPSRGTLLRVLDELQKEKKVAVAFQSDGGKQTQYRKVESLETPAPPSP